MSARAALVVKEKGLTNVAALKGGWAAWQRAGYPVEAKQPVAPTAIALVKETGELVAELGDPNAPVTIIEFSDFQ